MNKLKKCRECGRYTLKEICSGCEEKTKDAHYKFVKLKDMTKN